MCYDIFIFSSALFVIKRLLLNWWLYRLNWDNQKINCFYCDSNHQPSDCKPYALTACAMLTCLQLLIVPIQNNPFQTPIELLCVKLHTTIDRLFLLTFRFWTIDRLFLLAFRFWTIDRLFLLAFCFWTIDRLFLLALERLKGALHFEINIYIDSINRTPFTAFINTAARKTP